MNFSRTHFLVVITLFIGLAFRLHNIYDFAEFAGDQGRDAIIIFEHWESKEMLFLGPRTSTGQFPGPFFFYMIAPPLILSGFNPLAPTILITFIEALTIVPLFFLMKKLTNNKAALATIALYAVSPWMVEQSRIFWNPTTLPFFVSCILLAMHEFWRSQKRISLAILGLLVGIVVQLHASAYLYIPVTLLFVTYATLANKQKLDRLLHNIAILIGFAAIPLSPYLFFEITHGLNNIKGVFMASGNASALFSLSAPTHYYSFIIILVFVITGFFLFHIQKRIGSLAFYCISILLIGFSLLKIPTIMNPSFDIEKTRWAVESMSERSDNNSFAFAQISGASASDLHYRFYFLKSNTPVEPLESDEYKTLFLICDSATCSSDEEIQTLRVSAACYEKYCDREYPYIATSDWNFVESIQGNNITIYQFSSP